MSQWYGLAKAGTYQNPPLTPKQLGFGRFRHSQALSCLWALQETRDPKISLVELPRVFLSFTVKEEAQAKQHREPPKPCYLNSRCVNFDVKLSYTGRRYIWVAVVCTATNDDWTPSRICVYKSVYEFDHQEAGIPFVNKLRVHECIVARSQPRCGHVCA
eukprot:5986052-Amphidinium_carterae.2